MAQKLSIAIANPTTRKLPVKAKQPIDGKDVEIETQVEFEVLDPEVYRALKKDFESYAIDTVLKHTKYIEVLGDDEKPMAFSDDIKKLVLGWTWLHKPIITAFSAVQEGMSNEDYKKAFLKN